MIRTMKPITVKDVKTFITAPGRCDLLVVKVETSEPGLYGLGCATFTQRIQAVKTAIDEYLRPMMIGRDVDNIEDAWQVMYGSSYWRNGPVLNNAISGIDEALWDIKGKVANLPVYSLLGGKCRPAARIFAGAHAATKEEMGDEVEKILATGQQYIRLFLGRFGQSEVAEEEKPIGALPGHYINPKAYIKNMVEMFAYLRQRFGDDPEYMIDVHERLSPTETIMLAKALEPYHLYFLEDSLAPENIEWFRNLRAAVSTPLAMGELFNNVNEFKSLIVNREIDFIRCHISQLGGLTPAKKLAAFCEYFGVKTIWHGPGDLTPIGMAAQLHLDLATPNFAFQEHMGWSDLIYEMFPGAPEMKGLYMYPNDKPGFGVDFNEELAAKYPAKGYKGDMFMARLPDGAAVRS